MIFFIILIIFISTVSAVSSDIKDTYAPKETMIIELYGNILRQIDKSQIKLRGEKGEEIAFDGDIKRFEGRHFLWLRAPLNKGNYTIQISDIIENVDGYPEVVDYKKQFSVSGPTTDYAINPGAIFATSDFTITASLFLSSPIQITSDFPSQREITLRPGDNSILFSIANVQGPILKIISVGKYSVPAYIIGEEQEENNQNQTNNEQNNTGQNNTQEGNQTNQGNNQTNNEQNQTAPSNESESQSEETERQLISFNPGFIKGTILLSKERRPSYQILLTNIGNYTLQNLSFIYNREKFLISPENNIVIEPNKSLELNLTVIKITDIFMRGVVLAKVDDKIQDYLFLQFNVTTNETDVSTEYLRNASEQVSSYYCSELSGFICSEGEICEGQTVASIEGQCCLVKCTQQTTKGKSWIGYVIAAVLVIIVALIYSRYKKAKSPKINPIENILSQDKKV